MSFGFVDRLTGPLSVNLPSLVLVLFVHTVSVSAIFVWVSSSVWVGICILKCILSKIHRWSFYVAYAIVYMYMYI